jgi:cysteine desulfurase/selenocysteine lyase
MMTDIKGVRRQFPILEERIDGHPLIYLDNAATTQKPSCVLETLRTFYSEQNANINRSMHALAEAATNAYENARTIVAGFIACDDPRNVIFTRNATESINIIARSWAASTLKSGDVIALTTMEHHSNIVPWLQLKESHGIRLEWIPVNEEGEIDLRMLKKILQTGRVKLVSMSGLSNVLGCMTPLEQCMSLAHEHGARISIDGAQLLAHKDVNVSALNADFLAFSGHKLYGPTGIGVLYGKTELLEQMTPFLGGGDMIRSVTQDSFTCAELPRKFEAGTPAIADAIALGEALLWLQTLDLNDVHRYTQSLIVHAHHALLKIPGLTLFGPENPSKRYGCASFEIEGVHPHDLTDILGREGICLRAGHHCTQPLHKILRVPATTRLSVGIYNTKQEIDVCIAAIGRAVDRLRKQ